MSIMAGTGVSRYHPFLVALHWVVALMIVASLFGGLALLATTPNSDPNKPFYLQGHMAGGLALALLMVVRLVTRIFTAKPAQLADGWLGRLAKISHWAMYLLIFAMLSTGIGMAALGGLWPILSGQPVELPASFAVLPPHAGHVLFSRILIALIVLHVAAAVWHAMRRERIFGRMWFGRRDQVET